MDRTVKGDVLGSTPGILKKNLFPFQFISVMIINHYQLLHDRSVYPLKKKGNEHNCKG